MTEIEVDILNEEYNDIKGWLLEQVTKYREELAKLIALVAKLDRASETEHFCGFWLDQSPKKDGRGYKVEIYIDNQRRPTVFVDSDSKDSIALVQVPPFKCLGKKDWDTVGKEMLRYFSGENESRRRG